MTQVAEPISDGAQSQCAPSCGRYRSFLSSAAQAVGMRGPSCEAFPLGIPAEIWHNRYDHRQPYTAPDGSTTDNGLTWTPRYDGAQFPEYAMAPEAKVRADG